MQWDHFSLLSSLNFARQQILFCSLLVPPHFKSTQSCCSSWPTMSAVFFFVGVLAGYLVTSQKNVHSTLDNIGAVDLYLNACVSMNVYFFHPQLMTPFLPFEQWISPSNRLSRSEDVEVVFEAVMWVFFFTVSTDFFISFSFFPSCPLGRFLFLTFISGSGNFAQLSGACPLAILSREPRCPRH